MQFPVKSEPLQTDDELDAISSDLRVSLGKPADVETPPLLPDIADFNITPCSIVLPRIVDGAKLKLLTPAQKKFAYYDSLVSTVARDPPIEIFPSNNVRNTVASTALFAAK